MTFRQRKKQIKKMTLFVKNRPDYDKSDRTQSSGSRWRKHKLDLRNDYDNYQMKEATN